MEVTVVAEGILFLEETDSFGHFIHSNLKNIFLPDMVEMGVKTEVVERKGKMFLSIYL